MRVDPRSSKRRSLSEHNHGGMACALASGMDRIEKSVYAIDGA